MSFSATECDRLLAGTVTLPSHVVYRAFPGETVVLNLNSGRYHGLNPTAGKMLEVLERSPSVADAAERLAALYDQARDRIEADICALCRDLLDRGLIEVGDDGGR